MWLRPLQARSRGAADTSHVEDGKHSVVPESLIWIFGSGKTGSTWLSHMMADLEGYRLWAEPDIGKLFASSYERALEGRIHLLIPLVLGLFEESRRRLSRTPVIFRIRSDLDRVSSC